MLEVGVRVPVVACLMLSHDGFGMLVLQNFDLNIFGVLR